MRMFISALHYADVILPGRRKEVRGDFRHDIPIDIPEVSKKDLAPAIIIRSGKAEPGKPVVLSAYHGRLFAPYVPQVRMAGGPKYGYGFLQDCREAMTIAEFQALAGGQAPIINFSVRHDDPLPRRRGTSAVSDNRLTYTPASEFPRLEDVDVKKLQWNERPRVEEQVRRAAADLLVVDGKIWRVEDEPVLMAGTGLHRDRQARMVDVSFNTAPSHRDSLRQFRLDRMDDAVDWLSSRQGRSSVPLKQSRVLWKQAPLDPEIAIVADFEIVDASVLRRDDARVCLSSRCPDLVKKAQGMVGLLPSDAVDAFVTLKRFVRQEPWDESVPTAELFDSLIRLDEAVADLQGLDSQQFKDRKSLREGIAPLLSRWASHDSKLHTATAPAPSA